MKPEEIENLHNIIIDTSIDYDIVRACYDVEYDTGINIECAYYSPVVPFTLYDYTCIDYAQYRDTLAFMREVFVLFNNDSDTITVKAADLTIEQAQEIIDRNTVYFAKAKEYFVQKRILTELDAL